MENVYLRNRNDLKNKKQNDTKNKKKFKKKSNQELKSDGDKELWEELIRVRVIVRKSQHFNGYRI